MEPDKHMTDSIDRFPSPKDIHQLRSFLGLANQLGHFLPDLAQKTEKMRALLKKRVLYNWLPEHEKEFVKAKELLTSKHIVRFFDPKLPLSLLTDASSLHGLGFALIQYDEEGKPRLLQAGSCLLYTSDAADE